MRLQHQNKVCNLCCYLWKREDNVPELLLRAQLLVVARLQNLTEEVQHLVSAKISVTNLIANLNRRIGVFFVGIESLHAIVCSIVELEHDIDGKLVGFQSLPRLLSFEQNGLNLVELMLCLLSSNIPMDKAFYLKTCQQVTADELDKAIKGAVFERV
jgi:hypothetical protein